MATGPERAVQAAPIKAQAFLSNLPLFKELSAEELDRIAAGTSEVHAPRGHVLFRKGDACEGFHAVVYGQVKLALQTRHGDEKVVELVGPGQSFGEAVMFLAKPYVVTATTLADSLLLHIARETVFAEIERDAEFAQRMIAGLSRRLHHLVGELESLSLRSGMQRVIGYLLRGETGPDEAVSVRFPAKKSVIASHLNLTQEHFSRILHELSAARLIEVNGLEVRIPDAERLRRYGN